MSNSDILLKLFKFNNKILNLFRDLELASCVNLTDSGFIMLSKHCHDLERMDMEDCSLITDATILNLKNGCPYIFSLALSHCENLTDNGLIELCNSHRDRLEVSF